VKTTQNRLLAWYARHGRSHLPWRKTRNPYRILVSEFMLQQTQVERVLPKYRAFLRRFPNFETLAATSVADVVREWRGLGYNSRAVRLKRIAEIVVNRFGGVMPRDAETLRTLPGIGAYTAAAVRAFAFQCDDAAVDTNVRRVVERLTLGAEEPQALVPRGRGHDWNSALMDLGATICTARAPKCNVCPLRKFCAAAPIDAAALQRARPKRPAVRFAETTRFARGRIIDRLRRLPAGKRVSLLVLHRELAALGRTPAELGAMIESLARDGLVEVRNRQVALCE
jgi:A/G-specific adenine glycosylase